MDDEFLVVGPTPFAHPCETRGGDVIGQPMPDDVWMEVVGFQFVQESKCHVGGEKFGIVHAETAEKRRDIIAGDFVAGKLPVDDAVELSVSPEDVVRMEVAMAEIDGEGSFRAGEFVEFLPDGQKVVEQGGILFADARKQGADVFANGKRRDMAMDVRRRFFQRDEKIRHDVSTPCIITVCISRQIISVDPWTKLPEEFARFGPPFAGACLKPWGQFGAVVGLKFMEHFRLMGAMMELGHRAGFDDELPLVAVELDHMPFDATFGAASGAEEVADFVGVVEPIAYWEIHGPVVVDVGDVSEQGRKANVMQIQRLESRSSQRHAKANARRKQVTYRELQFRNANKMKKATMTAKAGTP